MESGSIAYLILAHTQPAQLARMISAIYDSRDLYFIHLDSQCEISLFEPLLSDFGNVSFIKQRFRTNWGGFGLIDATLSGLDHIRDINTADHIVLLSGQDYPIKPKNYIRAFILRNKEKVFMEYFPIPDARWSKGGTWRFPDYDKVKCVMQLYGGSQWISFPRRIIEFIFKFIDLNPLYIDYFRKTKIPDESFFQTMLFNWEVSEFESAIQPENLHLTIWGKNTAHPKILNSEDIMALESSRKLFGRKFDISSSAELLDYIDQRILKEHKLNSRYN